MDPPFKDAVLRQRRILMETYVIPMGIPREDNGEGKRRQGVTEQGSSMGDLWGPVWFLCGPCLVRSLCV